METININYAFNGFLYAPLFLADALGFFPRNTRLIYKEGDSEAIDALCRNSSGNQKDWFAICDPFSVDMSTKVPETEGDDICVVGTLIDKIPIWVYNTDPGIVPVNSEEGLAKYSNKISNLVCYKRGTTGYLLAKRLQKIFSLKDSDLQQVEFGREFESSITDRTAVLTSDALRLVRNGLGNQKIIFDYPKRRPKELHPFLFTAVLTLNNAVINENLWIVLSVLAGLKNAVELLKQPNLHDEHVELLVGKFDEQLHELGVTVEADKCLLIREAAKYLFRTEDIYSETFRPQKDAWDNAKGQWNELMGQQHGGIEERNEPIPSLLIKRDWKADPELRKLITDTIPTITSFLKNSVKWHHKAFLFASVATCVLEVGAFVSKNQAASKPFAVNAPYIGIFLCTYATQIVCTVMLFLDLGRLKVERSALLFGVVVTIGLGLAMSVFQLIQ